MDIYELKRIKELNEKMNKETVEVYVKAIMLFELNCGEIAPNDEELKVLLDIGHEIYMNIDYSTPTGVAVILSDWFLNNDISEFEGEEEIYKSIEDYYLNSEWQ